MKKKVNLTRLLIVVFVFVYLPTYSQSMAIIKHRVDSAQKVLEKIPSLTKRHKTVLDMLETRAYNDPQFCIAFVENVLFKEKEIQDSVFHAKVFQYYGISLIVNKQFDKADSVHQVGIAFVSCIQEHDVLKILVRLKENNATSYGIRGFRRTQLQKMNEILPLIRRLNDKVSMYNMYTNFALAYYELQEYSLALEYLYLARPMITDSVIRKNEWGFNEIILASIYHHENKQDSVLKYVDLAEKVIEQSVTPVFKARFSTLKGLALLIRNKPEEALKYIDKGVLIANEIKDVGEIQYGVLAKIDYYSHTNQWTNAIKIAHDFLYRNKHEVLDLFREEALREMVLLYEHLGNSKKAISTYKELITFMGDANKKKERSYTNELNFTHKYNDKVLEIERLQDSQAKSTIITQRDQLLIVILLMLVILVLIAIYFVAKARRREYNLNTQKLMLLETSLAEEKQKHIIDELIMLQIVEEKERNRIANELHDNVGGLLSSIKMSLLYFLEQKSVAASTDNKSARILAYIDDTKQELTRIVYNLTPLLAEKFGIIDTINHYCKKIQTDTFSVNLQVVSFLDNLTQESEMTLYRVLQEAMHNVFKHAFATEILIQIQSNDVDTIALTIEDNGIGMNLKDIQQQLGIGLKSLYSRVHQLNGSVTFRSNPAEGTSLYIICKPSLKIT